MPGYVIHLAVSKVYEKNNKIKYLESFERGIIAPDLAKDKGKSHYGQYSSNPDLDKFIQMNGISSSYKEGYFLHLVTDYLFYNKFLKKWDNHIYDDYDKLNGRIAKKYNIVFPEELLKVVKIKEGELELLDEEEVYRFIDVVGKIDIREMVKENKISFQNKIAEIQFETKEK